MEELKEQVRTYKNENGKLVKLNMMQQMDEKDQKDKKVSYKEIIDEMSLSIEKLKQEKKEYQEQIQDLDILQASNCMKIQKQDSHISSL